MTQLPCPGGKATISGDGKISFDASSGANALKGAKDLIELDAERHVDGAVLDFTCGPPIGCRFCKKSWFKAKTTITSEDVSHFGFFNVISRITGSGTSDYTATVTYSWTSEVKCQCMD